MNAIRRLSLALAFFALGGAPLTALASPGYPDNIRSSLGLAHKPACTICHQNDNGGKGTVRRPFGREIMQLGAKGKSPNSMLDALEEYDLSRYSVDGDCIPDVQELRDGTNPNQADDLGEGGADGSGDCVVPPGLEDLPIPQTGCSAARRANARSRDDLAETLTAIGLASLVMITVRIGARRRRRAL